MASEQRQPARQSKESPNDRLANTCVGSRTTLRCSAEPMPSTYDRPEPSGIAMQSFHEGDPSTFDLPSHIVSRSNVYYPRQEEWVVRKYGREERGLWIPGTSNSMSIYIPGAQTTRNSFPGILKEHATRTTEPYIIPMTRGRVR